MCSSSRRQRICSIISAFVESGRNSSIDMHRRRVSFHPREFHLSRIVETQRSVKLFPQVRIFQITPLDFSAHATICCTHDVVTV